MSYKVVKIPDAAVFRGLFLFGSRGTGPWILSTKKASYCLSKKSIPLEDPPRYAIDSSGQHILPILIIWKKLLTPGFWKLKTAKLHT